MKIACYLTCVITCYCFHCLSQAHRTQSPESHCYYLQPQNEHQKLWNHFQQEPLKANNAEIEPTALPYLSRIISPGSLLRQWHLFTKENFSGKRGKKGMPTLHFPSPTEACLSTKPLLRSGWAKGSEVRSKRSLTLVFVCRDSIWLVLAIQKDVLPQTCIFFFLRIKWNGNMDQWDSCPKTEPVNPTSTSVSSATGTQAGDPWIS